MYQCSMHITASSNAFKIWNFDLFVHVYWPYSRGYTNESEVCLQHSKFRWMPLRVLHSIDLYTILIHTHSPKWNEIQIGVRICCFFLVFHKTRTRTAHANLFKIIMHIVCCAGTAPTCIHSFHLLFFRLSNFFNVCLKSVPISQQNGM